MSAFVKSTGKTTTNGANSTSYAFGSAPASTANTLIGTVSTTQTVIAANITDNQSGTYVIDHTGNDGGVIKIYFFRRTTALSTGSTVTVTISGGSGDFYAGQVSEYSSVSTSNIITGTSGSGTTSPFTATLPSALNVGDLAVTAATADDNTANQGISNPPTGGTATWVTRAAEQATNTSASIVAADLISAGGTPESAITSCNTTTGRVGLIVGYKSASGNISVTFGDGVVTVAGQNFTTLLETTVAEGNITIAGQSVVAKISVAISNGAVTIAGQSVLAKIAVAVTNGTVTIAGQSMLVGIGQPVTGGVVTIAGQSVVARLGGTFSEGNVTIAGQTVTPVLGGNLSVTIVAGAVTLAGQSMLAALGAPIAAGAVSVVGQSITVRIDAPATGGVVTIAGQTITATLAGNISVTIAAGAVTLAGQSVVASLGEPIAAGAITIAGQNITAIIGGNLSVTIVAGAVGLAGQSIIINLTSQAPRARQNQSTQVSPVMGGLRAGPGGVGIGLFAWCDALGVVRNARLNPEDSIGVVLLDVPLGVDSRFVFFDAVTNTFRIREGLPVVLLVSGLARVTFKNGGQAFAPVYANVLDGSAIAGYSPLAELTPWSVATLPDAQGLATITTWRLP